MKNIAILEDNENVRNVLVDFLKIHPIFNVVLVASSTEEFMELWESKQLHLDLVLCDIGLPGKSGIEATWMIKQKNPRTLVMIYSVYEDQDKIFQALSAGATGYILKSSPLEKVKEGLEEMIAGGAILSPKIALKIAHFFNNESSEKKSNGQKEKLTIREIEILNLVQKGKTNKAISENLHISIDTVKFHLKNIYAKLQVSCRKDLFLRFRPYFD